MTTEPPGGAGPAGAPQPAGDPPEGPSPAENPPEPAEEGRHCRAVGPVGARRAPANAESADGPQFGRPGQEPLDVLVLAGGTGRRLGGVSKPDVVVAGARMIDHVLAGVRSLRGSRIGPGRTVVVAPAQVRLPAWAGRALEDPPLGGPVAGIGAGLVELARLAAAAGGRPAALTAVLPSDAPQCWQALPSLLARILSVSELEGACAQDESHRQYLLGIYRTGALNRAVAPGGRVLRDVAVRRALAGLEVQAVDLGSRAAAVQDLDTWESIRAWRP